MLGLDFVNTIFRPTAEHFQLSGIGSVYDISSLVFLSLYSVSLKARIGALAGLNTISNSKQIGYKTELNVFINMCF